VSNLMKINMTRIFVVVCALAVLFVYTSVPHVQVATAQTVEQAETAEAVLTETLVELTVGEILGIAMGVLSLFGVVAVWFRSENRSPAALDAAMTTQLQATSPEIVATVERIMDRVLAHERENTRQVVKMAATAAGWTPWTWDDAVVELADKVTDGIPEDQKPRKPPTVPMSQKGVDPSAFVAAALRKAEEGKAPAAEEPEDRPKRK